MPTENQSFQQLLVELKRKAGWNPQRADTAASITVLRQVSKFLGLKINNIQQIVRGNASGKYFAHRQLLANHRWLVDLTGWTEVIDATGTTARDIMSQGRRESTYAHVPLKIDMTSSGAADEQCSRYFRFPAVQNDIFSTQVWVKFADATLCKIISRIDFLDSGFSSLLGGSEHDTEQTTATSTYVELLNENRTAPASTAWVEVRLMVLSTAASADGTAHFSVPILEKRTSISTESERCIAGASAAR